MEWYVTFFIFKWKQEIRTENLGELLWEIIEHRSVWNCTIGAYFMQFCSKRAIYSLVELYVLLPDVIMYWLYPKQLPKHEKNVNKLSKSVLCVCFYTASINVKSFITRTLKI